jgi:O-antigen biosynthesis protein
MRAIEPPKVAYLSQVNPEPRSSAAGVRAECIIEVFRSAGWSVQFLGPELAQPNDSRFDRLISEISPDVVLFDRFYIEEQFGWRVERACPGALRVLDTVDLHGLRHAREKSAKSGTPGPLIIDEVGLRELASILRSDLALVISSFELDLLQRDYGVPPAQVELCRLLHADTPAPRSEAGEPEGFAWIGNFRHPPNLDSFLWLHEELWPALRSRKPGATLHAYGAYPTREVMALDDRELGFRVHGPAGDVTEAMARHRVNLAPLRFGAGIKGKIVDGWRSGLPVVTTPIGAEGLGYAPSSPWGGLVANTASEFVEAAVVLYENDELRRQTAAEGFRLAAELFDRNREGTRLLSKIAELRGDLEGVRARNVLGRTLKLQSHRSTEYFSRWIELKNRAPSGS